MTLRVLEPGAGRGAVVVDDLVAVRRHHGLLAVVLGGAAVGAGEEGQDLVPFCLVKMQRIAKGFGHGLFGQIVLGGA